MISIQHKIKLPILISIGSFILIMGIMFLTNPLYSITYVALFFLALFIFLVSGSVITLRLHKNKHISRHNFNKLLLIMSAVVLLIMLRSAKALNLIDLALMAVFFGGLGFYLNRR